MGCVRSATELTAFAADGFHIVRGMFDRDEIDVLRRAMEDDPEVSGHLIDRLDAHGAAARGSGIRITDIGTTMGACFRIWRADRSHLDRSGVENGCPRIVRGSHLLGRIDHVPLPGEGQNVADPARMAAIIARLEVVPCELDPGDAVLFHANTLRRSDQNQSRHRRWTLICCYNRVNNDTLVREDDRHHLPLEKVPDAAVTAAGMRFATGCEHFATRAFYVIAWLCLIVVRGWNDYRLRAN